MASTTTRTAIHESANGTTDVKIMQTNARPDSPPLTPKTDSDQHMDGSLLDAATIIAAPAAGSDDLPAPVEVHDFDMVIIGAGISGINTAYRYQESFKKNSYVVLEARQDMGGTWDLMRYPGIRSDSDLHTFGFAWRPWAENQPIAQGGLIVKYLKECAADTGIDKNILYQHKVKECRWLSRLQQWTLTVEVTAPDGSIVKKLFRGKFVVLGTGYYDYDQPLEAKIPGLENFSGQVIHPQFWPTDLDYTDKKIAVIGSGATAVTLIPALAQKAARVTMVQRSPSYVVAIPNRSPKKRWWERMLPPWLQHRIMRLRYLYNGFVYRRFLSGANDPERTKMFLARMTQAQLPAHIPYDPHFKPSYKPWAQRMCLCPDGDFFKALRDGKSDVATGVIKSVRAGAIELESGQTIDADIIVTATGLKMKYGGNADIFVDGELIEWNEKFLWRGVMIQDMPNIALVAGYTKASWTLGADATAHMVVRMIRHMTRNGLTSATPRISNPDMVKVTTAVGVMGLTSTYIMDALKRLPKASDEGPWQARGNYLWDMLNSKYFANMKENIQFVHALG